MLYLNATTERCYLKHMFFKNGQNRHMNMDTDTLQWQKKSTSSS